MHTKPLKDMDFSKVYIWPQEGYCAARHGTSGGMIPYPDFSIIFVKDSIKT